MTLKNYVIADLSHFLETYSMKIHTHIHLIFLNLNLQDVNEYWQ